MHLELALAGLGQPAPGDAPLPALPALELLCARARRSQGEARATDAWLGERFGLEPDALAAGALTAHGAGVPAEGLWVRADPVHLRLLRDRMALLPAPAFAPEAREAEALCAALNTHFAGRLELVPVRPEAWCARVHGIAAPEGRAPLELSGADVDRNLPGGADAARWHALLNEAQMLLHDHFVNEAREARGAPAINSIWPWGAGVLPQRGHAPWTSLAADDPLAAGLARLAGIPLAATPTDARACLAGAGEAGRHLVLLDALRAPLALGDALARDAALGALEASWGVPLLEALRAGRVGMLTLHLPEAGLSFEVTGGDLRRFWRRARPLSAWMTA